MTVYLLQMDLTQRFKDVAEIKNILYPHLEINKIYPITKAKLISLQFSPQIILLFILDNGRESVIIMNPVYSFAFTQNDINDIISNPTLYILTYRKKDCADHNYFEIETL
jgi:hypothetical protein